jgi:hypothetical protein
MLTRILYGVLACLLLLPTVASGQSELVIYKEGTGLYHRAGCPVVADQKDLMAMTRAQAESRGHKAHADCDPARQKAGSAPGANQPPAPVTVYLNDGKYYHRKDCPKLEEGGKPPKSALLETAGKSHWPCPDCRPPVRRKSAEPAVPGTGRRGR